MNLKKINNIATQGAWLFLTALCFFAPFVMRQKDIRISAYLVIGIAVCWLLCKGWTTFKINTLKKNAFEYILLLSIAYSVLGLLWTENLKQGLSFLELGLTITVLSFFFIWQSSINQTTYIILKTALVAGVFLSSLLIFREGIKPFIDESIHKDCQFCVVEVLIPMHRPYFAIYLILASCFVFSELLKVKHLYLKGGLFLVMLYFLGYFMVMMPKSAIIGGTIGIILVLVRFLRENPVFKKSTLFVGIFIFVLLLIGFRLIKNRADYSWQWQESSTERGIVWQASVEVLMKNYNYIFGVGTGDETDAIQEKLKPSYPLIAEKRLNAHNQYLAFWLRFGIPGLMMMLFIGIFPIAAGWKKCNYTLIFLGATLAIAYLTEDILNREAGVLMVCLWIPILLRSPNETDEQIIAR